MSKAIRYVECAHCGETVGSYYVTCPYCGYRLVDAKSRFVRVGVGGRKKSRNDGFVMVTLDPPPDLLEIAEALDAMAKPHVGSGWANTNYTDLPCTTPRQEAIWMEFNGITRGED